MEEQSEGGQPQEERKSFGRGRGNFRGPRRNNFGGPREMHKATCSECGAECEVPFKPAEGREVFCQECFKKRKRF